MAGKVNKRKSALGRGLGALLEDSPSMEDNLSISESGSVGTMNDINLEEIEVNPFQPRIYFDKEALQELSDSIKVQGIIQPITVRKLSKNKYQLISGERRFQASKLAGLATIPAYVRTADDQQMLEMALIENIQRENLNAIEIALSYQRLLSECDLKQEELGDRVGKNRTTVNNYLRLLKLPPDIQAAIRDKKISMGHARALISIDSVDKQLDIFNRILSDDLSVRKVEELVRTSSPAKKSNIKDPEESGKEIANLSNKLTSHFGTKVQIKSDGKKGEIKIPFISVDDLNRILEILDV